MSWRRILRFLRKPLFRCVISHPHQRCSFRPIVVILYLFNTLPSLSLIFFDLTQVCKSHSGILGKGLALSHSPTILEALEGNLPLHLQTNEHSFLEDFITCVQTSSGGRLAR